MSLRTHKEEVKRTVEIIDGAYCNQCKVGMQVNGCGRVIGFHLKKNSSFFNDAILGDEGFDIGDFCSLECLYLYLTKVIDKTAIDVKKLDYKQRFEIEREKLKILQQEIKKLSEKNQLNT